MKRYRRVARKLPDPQPGHPRQERDLRLPRRIDRDNPKDQQIGAGILEPALRLILKARPVGRQPPLITI